MHGTPDVHEISSSKNFPTSQIKRGNSTIELDNKIWRQNQDFEFKIQDMRSRYDYKVKESNDNSIKKYNHLLQDIERKTTSNKHLLHQFLKEKKLEVQ